MGVASLPTPPPTREQQHVGIPKKSPGDKVNLEVDVLGKYVERSLSSVLNRLGALEDWKQVGHRCPRLSLFVHTLSSADIIFATRRVAPYDTRRCILDISDLYIQLFFSM